MAYRLLLKPTASRQIGRIKGIEYIALRGVILGLADDPRPPGALKLTGMRNLWRVRVRIDGRAWRVIYQVDHTAHVVVILRVAARDEGTYRLLR